MSTLHQIGITPRYGFHDDWGQLLFLAGLVIIVVGFAAAPRLHPKPLRQE